VATRYDKLAANYLAFIQLASIRLWLRVNESTPLGSIRELNCFAPPEFSGRCKPAMNPTAKSDAAPHDQPP
jgi:hypothetical protein